MQRHHTATEPPDADPDQLELILDMTTVLGARELGWWLFGGWGLDAQLGRISRAHGDIECWVERSDADAVRDAFLSIGAEILETEPIEESRCFSRDGVLFSSAFFDRNEDGTFGVLGRWSDWVFPRGSFGASTGDLHGLEVPTMSLEGMLAMKEQYSSLQNGAPPRDKDVRDIAALRALIEGREPDRP